MNHQFSLATRLAWRYVWKKHESSLNTMLKICLLAIALGSCSLVLVVAIMNGFEHATYRQLQGIHSSLIMQSPIHEPLNVEKISEVMQREFPEVIGMSPRSNAYAFLYSDTVEEPHFVQLRGIMPTHEHHASPLMSTLIDPKNISLAELVNHKNVVIGQSLAELQGLRLGDTVQLFFAKHQQDTNKSLALDSVTVTIVGLFKTGIEEFDESVIMAHHKILEKYWQAPITTIGITPANTADLEKLTDALKERFRLHVYSWKELYPALVSALRLEKIASILILALIIFIASMTIISVIYMHITSKRKDIAILQVLGAPRSFIKLVFFLIGFFITTAGTALGMLLGVGLSLFFTYCVPIKLPDAYYSSHLSLELSLYSLSAIAVIIFSISLAAIFFSLRSLQNINTLEVLKNA